MSNMYNVFDSETNQIHNKFAGIEKWQNMSCQYS